VVVHPLQASPTMAKTAFAFLGPLGFTLQERWVTGGESFRDGWRLTFSGPTIQVIVQYMDAQFEVTFARPGIAVSYLEMDRDLFDRRSGFQGDMFPPRKLEAAINRSPRTFTKTTDRPSRVKTVRGTTSLASRRSHQRRHAFRERCPTSRCRRTWSSPTLRPRR
jgi:hypothetical protein